MESINRKVTVTYYGMLAEKLGIIEEAIVLPYQDITLREFMIQLHPELDTFTFSTAVDLELTDILKKDAQPNKIDIMPPFAGG